MDAVNVEPGFSADTADEYNAIAKQHGNAAIARITADQSEYDRLAEHGLRQSTLPPPLEGPNTIVSCPPH
jgi:hypothetical protein